LEMESFTLLGNVFNGQTALHLRLFLTDRHLLVCIPLAACSFQMSVVFPALLHIGNPSTEPLQFECSVTMTYKCIERQQASYSIQMQSKNLSQPPTWQEFTTRNKSKNLEQENPS
jgi:hypothetical protein